MRRAILLGFALVPVLAGADEVFTRGGGRLTGEIVERGPDSIVIDIGAGRIGLPLSYVERIVPGVAPLTLYRERARAVAPGDRAGWLALAQWARDHDLPTQARQAFEHVLSLDPGNASAHRALGHVKVGGAWMTEEDGYRARGYVSFEGTWMTLDERQAIVAERAAAAEQERAAAEAAARVREAEARARIAEAEAGRAEDELRRARTLTDLDSYWPVGIGFAPRIGVGITPFFPTSFHRGFHRRLPSCVRLNGFRPGLTRPAGFAPPASMAQPVSGALMHSEIVAARARSSAARP